MDCNYRQLDIGGDIIFKKFFKQINKAMLGSLSVFVFFVLGFIWWIFDSDYLMPMWSFSLVIIGCYLICIIIYALCSSQREPSIFRLPIVKSITRINDKLIFIVEKNELFNQGYYVTICYQEGDGLEIVLGLGYVQSVNSSGFLQIEMVEFLESSFNKELYSKIDNTSSFRKAIKIKPSIYKELLIKEEYDV